MGTNQLCTLENLPDQIENIFIGNFKAHIVPDLWDGHTAERIVDSIRVLFRTNKVTSENKDT
jgi:hypothetical protein